jgi:chemoreceptor zinc-binding protein
MNLFDSEIAGHGRFLNRVEAYVKRPDGSLRAADIRSDNACGLGQWIYADGLWLADVDLYAALKDLHARFHTTMADAVALADSGKVDLALAALNDKSSKIAFMHLINAAVSMKQKA